MNTVMHTNRRFAVRASRWLVAALGALVLSLNLAAPARAGEPLDKEYNLFYFSGWAGTVFTNGLWGYKRHDYVGEFIPVRMNVPVREFNQTNGLSFSWPPDTNAPAGKVVVSTVGIVAYPSTIDMNTLSSQWTQDLGAHVPPSVAGACGGGTYYLYVQRYPLTNGNDWVIGPATGTLFAADQQCSAGTTAGGCRLQSGNTTVEAGCVKVTIPLGGAADKANPHSGGMLVLSSDRMKAGLGDRAALVYRQSLGENAVSVKTTNQMSRIDVNNGYVAAETTQEDGGYSVRVLKGAVEVSRTEVRQPSPGVLRVKFYSNTLGTWSKEFSETTLGNDPQAVTLKEFALDGQQVLRTKVSAEWNNTPTEIVQAKATRNAEDQILQQTQQVYTQQANGVWRNTETVVGLGAEAQVSYQQFDAQGRLTQSVDHQGRWTRSVYAGADDVTPAQMITPWQHAAVDAPANQCRVQNRTFVRSITSSNSAQTVETVTESILGIPVSVTTDIRLFKPGWGAVLTSTNIIQTALGTYTTAVHYDGNGYPWKTTHPDGTVSINNRYSLNGTSAPFSNVLLQAEESFRGQLIGTNYWNGRRSLSLSDPKTGTPARHQSWEIRDGVWLLTQDDRTLSLDSEWRVTANVTLLGTNTTTYSCCGVSSTVDAEGNETRYSYDDLKRQVAVERAGVTTSNVFDAADRVIATYRYPTNNIAEATLVSSNTYNTAGELVATTDARTNTTTYAHWTDAAGYVWRQTTYPDGSYRKEQSYRDGHLYQVTGTAVHGVSYSNRLEVVNGYGVLVTRESKLDAAGADTQEWTETWTDGNGRTLKTVRSDASSVNGIPASQSFYNSKGQLERQVDADGVTTLFGYNLAGEQIVSAIDMDQSGTIGATDRISSNATSIVAAHGTTVLRRDSWQFGETGPVLVSTSDATGDSLSSWQISFGLTNSTLTDLTDRFHARRVVTAISPDGSRSVTISEEGRVKSVQRLDATGVELSLLTYAYDGLGRVVTNSDNRITTTYAYNSADQQTAVTVLGTNVTAQTTSFDYDKMGRRTVTTLPDGAHTYVAYLFTGEVATNWGDRTYPVAYTYDHAGRMQTMTTWQDFAGKTGAAVTTWNYDPHSGQLASKRYHDNLGPDYTYTPAGRLHTRLWARTVNSQRLTTTYAYNNAGDLAVVDYSDASPDVTYTYDLRGRQTSVSSVASVVQYSYSDANQLVAETWTNGPLNGLTVTNTYDSLLRRSQLAVVSGQGTVVSPISYQYDASSRLSAVGQASLLVQYAYVPGAPGLVSNITYWSAGAPMMRTAKTYDNLNRLLKIESTTGGRTVSSHSYGLNQANQRTKRTDADGSYWDYGYDSLGQVTNAVRKWADGTLVAGQQYGYLFDDIGNRQRSEVSGQRSDYSANLLNQYTQRTVPGAFWELGHAHSNATITVAGQTDALRKGEYFAKELTLANGSGAVYTSLVTVAMLSTTTNGEPVQATSSTATATATTTSNGNGGSNKSQWLYNEQGKLIKKLPNGKEVTPGAASTNSTGATTFLESQSATISVSLTNTGHAFLPKTPEQYTHDADGNLTSDGRWVYSWDGENRLIGMETMAAAASNGVPRQKLAFAYDHQSRRIQKQVYAWTTDHWSPVTDLRFVYDGWNLLAELDALTQPSSLTVQRSYAWGLDLSGTEQGAGGIGGLLWMTSHLPLATCHFASFDGNGNVAALLNTATGQVSAEYEYSPFGETIRATGTAANDNVYGFSTKYTDAEAGLLYYGYRYYRPNTGRWLSRDPMEEEGCLSLYIHTDNQPASFVDYLGMLKKSFELNEQWEVPLGVVEFTLRAKGSVTFEVKTTLQDECPTKYPRNIRTVYGVRREPTEARQRSLVYDAYFGKEGDDFKFISGWKFGLSMGDPGSNSLISWQTVKNFFDVHTVSTPYTTVSGELQWWDQSTCQCISVEADMEPSVTTKLYTGRTAAALSAHRVFVWLAATADKWWAIAQHLKPAWAY